MIELLLIMLLLLLILSLFFQIRDWIYMTKYQRPIDSQIDCNYKYKMTTKKGYTIVECRNKFYCKKFAKNNNQCPEQCLGKKYPGTTENFEMMSSTEPFYVCKKILCFSGTLFGTFLTIINIIDKLS